MLFAILFNIMPVLIILYLIGTALKKYNFNNKKYLIALAGMLVLNTIITYKYIQIKSSHNTSTYIAYNFVEEAFHAIKYPNKMENEGDIIKLVTITEEINKTLQLLELDLRASKLTYDSERFYSLVNSLKNNLNEFIHVHNTYFSNDKPITPQLLNNYKKLKVELVMIEHYLSQLGSSQTSQFGIKQYELFLSAKEKYDWILKLEERVANIDKIVEKMH